MKITTRDIEIINFASRFWHVTLGQICKEFNISQSWGSRIVSRLTKEGFLENERLFFREPGVYLSTRQGVSLAGGNLGPSKINLQHYHHHLKVVDVYQKLMKLQSGSEWESEREIRKRLNPSGKFGRSDEHVPDGVLILPNRVRVAIEVELSPKAPERLSEIVEELSDTYDKAWYFVGGKSPVEDRVKEVTDGFTDISVFDLLI